MSSAQPIRQWNLNAGWSYQPWNHAIKNTKEIVGIYQRVQEKEIVFLLNVVPHAFGDIHPDEQRVLLEIGMALHGKK